METDNRKLILQGKRFFIDQKVDSATRKKIRDCLTLLGGTAEDFLDRTINYVITTGPEQDKGSADCQSSIDSPFSCVSQASPQNTQVQKNKSKTTNSRWRNLALRAAKSNRTINDPIQTARNFGIKIRNAEESLQWLLKKTKNIEKSGQSSTSSNSSQCILLKAPCIKVDDNINKPFYEELDSLYHLDETVEGHGSPFKQPGKSPHRAEKKRRSSNKEKRGFCECCQASYLSEKKHFKSAEHIKFGKTPENFAKLDQFVVNNSLGLSAMMKRHGVTAGLRSKESTHDQKRNDPESDCDLTRRDNISCNITVFDSQATSSKKSPMKMRTRSPRCNPSPAHSSPSLRRLLRKRRRQESSSFNSSPQKPYLLRSMRSSELNDVLHDTFRSPVKPGSSSNACLKSSSSPLKRPVR